MAAACHHLLRARGAMRAYIAPGLLTSRHNYNPQVLGQSNKCWAGIARLIMLMSVLSNFVEAQHALACANAHNEQVTPLGKITLEPPG